jgi:hypothetical protein
MWFASSNITSGMRSMASSPAHQKEFRANHPLPIRFDPVYSDARAKAAQLGEFNFFNAWMSQPKSQLETFRAWAGKDSDIR